VKDQIEFYEKDGMLSSVESSMVPSVGQFISIAGVTYKVTNVTFALDYSDMVQSQRKMRCNVDLKKAKP
jgi:hypothetical protein